MSSWVSNSSKLRAIFEWLYEAYGPQHWWPGDTPFEVMVGAILTQNTAWSNVEKAMASLKRRFSQAELTPNFRGIGDGPVCLLRQGTGVKEARQTSNRR